MPEFSFPFIVFYCNCENFHRKANKSYLPQIHIGRYTDDLEKFQGSLKDSEINTFDFNNMCKLLSQDYMIFYYDISYRSKVTDQIYQANVFYDFIKQKDRNHLIQSSPMCITNNSTTRSINNVTLNVIFTALSVAVTALRASKESEIVCEIFHVDCIFVSVKCILKSY